MNPVAYAAEIEAAIVRVLGPDHAAIPLHEWAATSLARSRGAVLGMQDGRLEAADAASLDMLEQALRDIAVFYKVPVGEFRAMTPMERVAYLDEARRLRGGFGGPNP